MVYKQPCLSIVFSFRNEEQVLPELIRRTQTVLASLDTDYELIFINDASTDRSLEFLMEAQKNNPKIKILTMARRFGVAACLMAGLEHASGDAVITLDADLQDPPELMHRLIAQWKKGAEIVHTVRTRRGGESWLKRIVTSLGYRIWKMFIPGDLLLNSGDFRLLTRKAVSEVVKHRSPTPFFRGVTRNLDLRQDVVFYEREKRYAGKTHFSLLRSWAPFQTFFSALLTYSRVPILFSAGWTLLTLSWILKFDLSRFWIISGLLILGQIPALMVIVAYGIQKLQRHSKRPLYQIAGRHGF